MYLLKFISIGLVGSGVLYGMQQEQRTHPRVGSFERLDTPTAAGLRANLDRLELMRGVKEGGLESPGNTQRQTSFAEESSQSGTVVKHNPDSESMKMVGRRISAELDHHKPDESWPMRVANALQHGGRKVTHPELYQRKPLANVDFKSQLAVAQQEPLEEIAQGQPPHRVPLEMIARGQLLRRVPLLSCVYGQRLRAIKKFLGYSVPCYYPHAAIKYTPCEGDFGTVAIENHLNFKTNVRSHTIVKTLLSGACALFFVFRGMRAIVNRTRFAKASYVRAFEHGISLGISGICAYACNKFFERRRYNSQLQDHIASIAHDIDTRELRDLENRFDHDLAKLSIVRQLQQIKERPSH